MKYSALLLLCLVSSLLNAMVMTQSVDLRYRSLNIKSDTNEYQNYTVAVSVLNAVPQLGFFLVTRPPKPIFEKPIAKEHLALIYSVATMMDTGHASPQDMVDTLNKYGYCAPQEGKQ